MKRNLYIRICAFAVLYPWAKPFARPFARRLLAMCEQEARQ